MTIDMLDRQELDDVKLARMHLEAYNAMMEARRNYEPFAGIWNRIRRIFCK